MDLKTKEKIEIDFWKNDKHERPTSASFENIISKASQGKIFLAALDKIEKQFSVAHSTGNVMELGAGQGWASCLFKAKHPKCNIHVSDISPYAIKSVHKWERIFDVKIDASSSSRSYEIPADDNSIDFIFTFAAAHHFVEHKKTLNEIAKKLTKNGIAAFIYEPATNDFWYPMAKWRVNRKRPDVPEDLLKISDMKKFSARANLQLEIIYFPDINNRGLFELIYYKFLGLFPFLNRLLPSTVILLFTKNTRALKNIQ